MTTEPLRDPSAIVSPDTVLGLEPRIGAFCVLGVDGPDEAPLEIGDHTTIRSHAVLYRGTRIGDRAHIGHGALVREHCVLGDDVSIGTHAVVEHRVTIGNRVRLHTGCFVPEYSVLADGAWLGPNVTVTNAKYPNRPDTKSRLQGVQVGQDAAIGAGAILLPGVRIGAGALVGAGAVVVHDVPDGAVVAGNPATSTR